MKLGWVYSRQFLRHDTGSSHVERAERLQAIVETLQDTGLLSRLTPVPFMPATIDQLSLVHEAAYVDIVRMMCDEGFTWIGSQDTCVCRWSYDVAAAAAGGVLAACDAVMNHEVDRAFCAVRPPGHHAESDQALGFCLFNNVAVAAEHLVRRHGLSRVAIVDIDVHHGNGIQHIFESRPDVFYLSLHERPGSLPFPGSGGADETGFGPGQGYTLNVPLTQGSGEDDYLAAMDDQIIPALDRYRPEFVLLCAGFDALMWDDVANISLEPRSFEPITQRLTSIADRYADGRLVSVLEGGYDLPNLGSAVAAHISALLDSSDDLADA